MQANALLKKYLQQQYMMQLATVAGTQPWCCTVYYVTDSSYAVYWASLPTRRHSQELKSHNQVAATIPVKFINGEKVIGIQLQGMAEEVPLSPSIKPIAETYATKFHRDAQWVDDFTAGKTAHKLYKLTPSLFVLFDEVNFPGEPRQELSWL